MAGSLTWAQQWSRKEQAARRRRRADRRRQRSVSASGALLQPIPVSTRTVPALEGRSWVVASTAICYLGLITGAELVTTLIGPLPGALCHMTILVALVIHATLCRGGRLQQLLLALMIAPLIRIVTFEIPLAYFSQRWWYLLTSGPLFATAFALCRTLGLRREEIGLCLPRGRWAGSSAVIFAAGALLGEIEFSVLRPAPIFDALTLPNLLLGGLILLVGTGLLEELLFRGVLQRVVERALGPGWSIVYVSLLFGVLHIGHRSAIDVVLVSAIGVLLALARRRTRSLLGPALAHGLANTMLFIVVPLWRP